MYNEREKMKYRSERLYDFMMIINYMNYTYTDFYIHFAVLFYYECSVGVGCNG